ncbi:MAG: hypothetical protein ABL876_02515 [Chitinophagaceae bacterium]
MLFSFYPCLLDFIAQNDPAEVVNHFQYQVKKEALPGASVDERMYFATAEQSPAEPENTYVHQQNLQMPSLCPKYTF